ncbi:MAG TPA: glycosyltransferase, partial [Pseudoxanthomonas sp.]|nr:glycosyltransferase [Pseudoxanthomonas sp.]
IVGTVGRLHPVKDQSRLLQALHALRAQVPQAVLAVVGDGQMRHALQDEADGLGLRDAVRFLGDRDDVPRLLAGMEAFALPSLSEGYSVALLEACAAGLPIVATDVGGNREIVRDGRNGRLVAAADAAAFASALAQVMRDPGLAERMGMAGREWVVAEGSFRTMASRYQRLYAGKQASTAPTMEAA